MKYLIIICLFALVSCKKECCFINVNGLKQCCEQACDFTDRELEVLVATGNQSVICL